MLASVVLLFASCVRCDLPPTIRKADKMPVDRKPRRIEEYDNMCEESKHVMWRVRDDAFVEEAVGMFCAPVCAGRFEAVPKGDGTSITHACHRKKRSGQRFVQKATTKYLILTSPSKTTKVEVLTLPS